MVNLSWSLEESVHFFTHPGVMNMTYPCTTLTGGMDPGKPCHFPVNYKGTIQKKCFQMDTSSDACVTKRYNQTERDFYHFGFCDKRCNGELPGPDSPYNLAKKQYKNLWTSNFYDFSSYTKGLCHTYDPPIRSKPGLRYRLYFMLKKVGRFNDFDIFFHEKGQFWPRLDMFTFGQDKPVSVSRNDEMIISFKIKVENHIKDSNNDCEDDDDYSLTDCLLNFARTSTNCTMDFVHFKGSCSKDSFNDYFKLLVGLKHDQQSEIMRKTGCKRKCNVVKYYLTVENKKIMWRPDWASEVYVQPESSTIKKIHEIYSFDENSLVSSIGGYLGLFLGWSVLSLTEAITLMAFKCFKKKCFG